MGTALLKGTVTQGVCPAASVRVFDPSAEALAAAMEAVPGMVPASSAVDAVRDADVVLLCVKPAGIAPLLASLSDLPSTLFISIAAGITLATMESAAPRHRLVRVMPNTPALIGQGAAAFAIGAHATEADAQRTATILEAVGYAIRVPESLLDAVTGLSGSGPAYVYTIIEALADGAVCEGLSKADALTLAAQTVAGAANMVLETKLHPAVLRDQVTSPGGTTIAGLAALEAGGLRAALIAGVRAATQRARELGAK
jgi:pyrroline-5-carboxylate reductase